MHAHVGKVAGSILAKEERHFPFFAKESLAITRSSSNFA